MGLTGEKGYHSVDSGARYHFIIGLVIDLHDKTVQTNITIGNFYQALAPPHGTAKGGLMTITASHCSPTAASIKLLMSCPFVAVSGGVTPQ